MADRVRALLAYKGKDGELAAEIAHMPSPAEVAARLPEPAGRGG